MFHRDNAPVYKRVSIAEIYSAGFKIFNNCRPNPQRLFLLFQIHGTHFCDDEEVMTTDNEWLEEQDKDFFQGLTRTAASI